MTKEIYGLVSGTPIPKAPMYQFLYFTSYRSGNETYIIRHVTQCDHVIKSHMALCAGARVKPVTSVPVLMLIALVESRYNMLCFSREK